MQLEFSGRKRNLLASVPAQVHQRAHSAELWFGGYVGSVRLRISRTMHAFNVEKTECTYDKKDFYDMMCHPTVRKIRLLAAKLDRAGGLSRHTPDPLRTAQDALEIVLPVLWKTLQDETDCVCKPCYKVN
jgi:hypothetical protein